MRKFAIVLVAFGLVLASCATNEEVQDIPEPAPITDTDTSVIEPELMTAPEQEPKLETKAPAKHKASANKKKAVKKSK